MAEVAFFGARSLIDGFDEEGQEPHTLVFIGQLLDFFLNTAIARESFIVSRSVMLFIDQAAKLLIDFRQQAAGVISYLFRAFISHPKLQSLAVKTLREYSQYCKSLFTLEIVASIHSFLSQHYALLSLEHAQMLAETLTMTVSAIDKNNLGQNLNQVSALPMQTLQAVSDQMDRFQILKAFSLLTSMIKGVEDMSQQDLERVLLPLFNQTWPSLVFVLRNRSNDAGLVDTCCEFLIRAAKALKTGLAPFFSTVKHELVQTFAVNPKNFRCVETLSVLLRILGHSQGQLQQEIGGSIEDLCQLILPKTFKSALKPGVEDSFVNRIDVDVTTQFASLLNQVVSINPEMFISTESFDECVALFSQVIAQVN